MKKVFILFIFFESNVFCASADSLTGVWQDNESVGAGWSNTFLFFYDGTFKFFYSQMDHRKRETGYSGTFRLVDDGLNLYVSRRNYLEGGKLVRDETGGEGDSVLVDAEDKTLLFDPPELIEMSISKIYSDTEFAMGKYIYLDAIKFFLMSKNPADLLHEFEGK
jgi:hypothetical protein